MNERGKREPQNVRNVLRDVLPIKAPYTMNINPSGICNFNCYFCPTNNKKLKPEYRRYLDSQQMMMSMETFNNAVNGIKELEDQTKVIYLVGQGEPLLNPNIAYMVDTLKKENVCREVRIITNGTKLTSELARDLVNAGLDVLKVSVEALDSDGYKQICGVDFDFNRLVENVETFYSISRGSKTVLTTKILTDSLVNKDDLNRFYDIFEPISDYQEIRNVETYWPDFAFEVSRKGHELTDISEMGPGGICSGMFTEGNIQPNGDICLCRIDWAGNLILGNVNRDSFKKIWDSEERKRCLLANLDGKRDTLGICSKCAGPCFGEVITEKDAELIRKRLIEG